MIAHITRWILTLILLYFVYLETGIATTIFATLVFAHCEIVVKIIKKIKES